MALAADGRTALLVRRWEGHYRASLWDVVRDVEIAMLPPRDVSAVCLAPDATRAFVGDRRGMIHAFDLAWERRESAAQAGRRRNLRSSRTRVLSHVDRTDPDIASLVSPPRHFVVQVDPDQTKDGAPHGDRCWLSVCEAASGCIVWRSPEPVDTPSATAVSRGGRYLVWSNKRRLELWDINRNDVIVERGHPLHELELATIGFVEFSPDDTTAILCWAPTPEQWELEWWPTGMPSGGAGERHAPSNDTRTIVGGRERVRAGAFAGDDDVVLGLGDDLAIARLSTGEIVGRARGEHGTIVRVATGPDAGCVVTHHEGGVVAVWDLEWE